MRKQAATLAVVIFIALMNAGCGAKKPVDVSTPAPPSPSFSQSCPAGTHLENSACVPDKPELRSR